MKRQFDKSVAVAAREAARDYPVLAEHARAVGYLAGDEEREVLLAAARAGVDLPLSMPWWEHVMVTRILEVPLRPLGPGDGYRAVRVEVFRCGGCLAEVPAEWVDAPAAVGCVACRVVGIAGTVLRTGWR